MEELKELHIQNCKRKYPLQWEERATCASKEMCIFLVINISSLQLIPVNMIAYRSQYGSLKPAAIIAPAILATTISTVVGVVFALIMARRDKRADIL